MSVVVGKNEYTGSTTGIVAFTTDFVCDKCKQVITINERTL